MKTRAINGTKIQALREARGLTQEQFAEANDMSARQVQRVESGAPSKIATLNKIASFFDVPVTEFFIEKTHGPLPDLTTAAAILQGIATLSTPQKRFVYALALGDASYIETQPELAPLAPLLKELLKLR